MRKLFARILRSPKKLFIVSFLAAAAVILPASTLMADSVVIEGYIGVLNQTAGQTTYQSSTSATYDQVVKVEVWYHNREQPDSGKIAQNLRVKIAMPTQAGATQTVSTTISADNSNTVTDSAVVNTGRSDAYLQYIPGSAVWKHNVGTNSNIQYVEQVVSDSIVTSGSGLVLENEQPCYNFSASVTILARVVVPAVQITKVSRVLGTSTWSANNTANPGDTMEYKIAYKNIGNTMQNNVTLRDALPPHMQVVAGSAKVYDATYPGGVAVNANSVVTGGINAGNYGPGANAFLIFQATMPQAGTLACGATPVRNVAVAQPQGMSEYYNVAITTVTRTCVTPQQSFSCDALDVALGNNRTVTATVHYTVSGGASLRSISYNFGDSTQSLVTDQTTVTHQYSQDGDYTIAAVLSFDTNSGVQTASCTKAVSIRTSTTPVTLSASTTATPKALPNTGVGDTLGIFAGASSIGAAAHYAVNRRNRR